MMKIVTETDPEHEPHNCGITKEKRVMRGAFQQQKRRKRVSHGTYFRTLLDGEFLSTFYYHEKCITRYTYLVFYIYDLSLFHQKLLG